MTLSNSKACGLLAAVLAALVCDPAALAQITVNPQGAISRDEKERAGRQQLWVELAESGLRGLRLAQEREDCEAFETLKGLYSNNIHMIGVPREDLPPPGLVEEYKRQYAVMMAQGCPKSSPVDDSAPVQPVADLPSTEIEQAAGTAAPQAPQTGSGLDWLIGVWRIPDGGAVGFRMDADGTASGYIAESTEALDEAGYPFDMIFLRGCADVTKRNTSVWRHSARCDKGFRKRWQGGGILKIKAGEAGLELPTYIGSPIAGYAKLERTSLEPSTPLPSTPQPPPPPSEAAAQDENLLRMQREVTRQFTLNRLGALRDFAVASHLRHVKAVYSCDRAAMEREVAEMERLVDEFFRIERGDVDISQWLRIAKDITHARDQSAGRRPENCP